MSSTQYISYPIETDPEDILNDAYSYLQTVAPGWIPAEGNLDVWLLESIASQAAESRDVASDVPISIFRWFGANLLGIPPIDSTPATATTTWYMVDNKGYTIPSGTQVGITDDVGDVIAFETMDDVSVYPGSTVTATGAVEIVATVPGADGTGLGTAGQDIELLDPLDYVTRVVLNTVTSGGQDAESDEEYLNRLASLLTLLAPRPILPNDFAIFARNVPGVWRATAIDLFNPNTGTYNNPRTITIAVVDEQGNACSTAVKNAVQADLTARREINFQVFVIDPTYTTIDVTYTVQAATGNDPAIVKTGIDNALNAYLSPGSWGTTEADPRAWVNQPVVRYLEVAQVINNVAGVDYIVNFTTRKSGGTMSNADITMTGVVPLPRPGVITGTVNA